MSLKGIADSNNALQGKVNILRTREPTLQEKSVIPTESAQNVIADVGFEGLSMVKIGAIPDEYKVPSGMLPIINNGTYDVSSYASAEVNVPSGTIEVIPDGYIKPSGKLAITENGTHDVTGYASAEVNVPTGITPSGTLTITENGTHDVTNYASADVNVSGGGAYQGEYADSTTYAEGDIVKSEGNVYRSLQNDNIGHTPAGNIGMYWEQLNAASGGGGAYKGEYSGYDYDVGDIVTYKGNVYLCLLTPIEGMPDPDSPYVTDYWEQLNSSNPIGSKTISAGTYRISYTSFTNVADNPNSGTVQISVSGTAYSESDSSTVVDFTSISIILKATALGAYIWNGSTIVFNLYSASSSPAVVTFNSDITLKGFWVDLFNLISERI